MEDEPVNGTRVNKQSLQVIQTPQVHVGSSYFLVGELYLLELSF